MRVAVVCDLLEEHWPSMDLVASMLSDHLPAHSSPDIDVVLLRPTMKRRLTALPILGTWRRFDRVDRIINRFRDYPRWLRRFYGQFDVFHIVDHSYAHLAHVLPGDRTVVTCHDVDAFLSLVDPEATRSKLPKFLTRRILSGMRRVAHVTCDSVATSEDLRRYGLVPAERLSVVYNGVHPVFSPAPDEVADRFIDRLIAAAGSRGGTHAISESAPADPARAGELSVNAAAGDQAEQPIYLLHVGSTIPRKRIDILLQIVAAVREQRPLVRLLKAGGYFTSAQRAMIHRLNLEPFVVTLPYLEPSALAALYRKASVVLLPSEREGFGLPIVESMACCTPVVATDSAVFHEMGGSATLYAPFGDIIKWRNAVLDLLLEAQDPVRLAARRRICLEHAAPFTWRRHAGSMVAIYREVRHFAEMRHPARPSDEEAELAS